MEGVTNMSQRAWQDRCGQYMGYDHEAQSSCHVADRELQQEFDAVDSVLEDWQWDKAAYSDCVGKTGGGYAGLLGARKGKRRT